MARQGTPLTPKKRRVFIVSLAHVGNVSEAARIAGFSRDAAYDHRTRDRAFASAWDDALQQAADAMEQEARRRGADGWDEPVYHQGEVCGTVRKYSDTLLIFLLKGARPEKYREKVAVEHSGTADVNVVIRNVQAVLEAVMPHDTDVRQRVVDGLMELDASEDVH